MAMYHEDRTDKPSRVRCAILPKWALLALGYTLFIWVALDWITIGYAGPDLLMSAFVYLASHILLCIRRGSTRWLTFVLLGVVLGCGYLTKAFMFPMSFIFLGISMFLVKNLRSALPRVLIALIVFFLVCSPLIVALTKAKGYPTFGLSGKLNYAWHVNGTAVTTPVHA
jgi:4-amino-4-deoxy-L-arabinose transferase-like glycosyltransferase